MSILEKYFELSATQRELFVRAVEQYTIWNERVNVVSRKDMENFVERHVLHSLSIAKLELIEPGHTVLDLGCGGGFPVVPLAVLMPEVKFTAVDSIGKKIKVVQAVCEELGLTNVQAVNARVENLSGKWDWVVSRAVAPQGQLMEWVAGRWNKGVLTLKGGEGLSAELSEARLPKGAVAAIQKVADFFDEPFFETKSIVVVKR